MRTRRIGSLLMLAVGLILGGVVLVGLVAGAPGALADTDGGIGEPPSVEKPAAEGEPAPQAEPDAGAAATPGGDGEHGQDGVPGDGAAVRAGTKLVSEMAPTDGEPSAGTAPAQGGPGAAMSMTVPPVATVPPPEGAGQPGAEESGPGPAEPTAAPSVALGPVGVPSVHIAPASRYEPLDPSRYEFISYTRYGKGADARTNLILHDNGTGGLVLFKHNLSGSAEKAVASSVVADLLGHHIPSTSLASYNGVQGSVQPILKGYAPLAELQWLGGGLAAQTEALRLAASPQRHAFLYVVQKGDTMIFNVMVRVVDGHAVDLVDVDHDGNFTLDMAVLLPKAVTREVYEQHLAFTGDLARLDAAMRAAVGEAPSVNFTAQSLQRSNNIVAEIERQLRDDPSGSFFKDPPAKANVTLLPGPLPSVLEGPVLRGARGRGWVVGGWGWAAVGVAVSAPGSAGAGVAGVEYGVAVAGSVGGQDCAGRSGDGVSVG